MAAVRALARSSHHGPRTTVLAPVLSTLYLSYMRHSAILVLVLPVLTACLAPPTATAQVPDPASPRVVQVSGQASVQRVPDRATVQLAVETIAPSAREATAANAATMDRVLAAIRQLGVPDARIQTTRIDLHPRHETRRDGTPPAIVGYQAVNQVIVHLDDVMLVGRVVDAGVQAGANRVTGVNFQLSDPDAAYHDAIRLAVEKARAEAMVIAQALGETLGPPLQVTTGGAQVPPQFRMDAMRMEAAQMDTPVQPGELDVRATVSITFRLGS
jgi:uncharacterized protein